MGKFLTLEKDIYSVFDSASWKAENLNTYPNNFTPVNPGSQFIIVSIIPNGRGLNRESLNGVILIDIYVQAGNGTKASFTIADKLDSYLASKSITTSSGKVTQFGDSSIGKGSLDSANSSLWHITYSIPFNLYGVL